MSTGNSGSAANDIHCRCFLSYDLEDYEYEESILGAENDEPDNAESVSEFVEEIDISNKNVLENKMNEYEQKIANESVENAYIIQPDGKVHRVVGNEYSVNPNVVTNDLENSYIVHNHPESSTHYSFSAEDINLFLNAKLAVLRGIDYKYRYAMKRTRKTVMVSRDDIVHEFNLCYNESIQKGYLGEIDLSTDEYHEALKSMSAKYGFQYERIEL